MKLPRVGVSSCLLGSPVRFNGDHSRHDWTADVLAQQLEVVPCCPEMAMGMGSPRPALRLVQNSSGDVRLRTAKTSEDCTDLANLTAGRLAERSAVLDGFVLKKNSPSCGYERVKIYSESKMPLRGGRGFFATALRTRAPLMPMIEEGRLTDPEQRENFILRVFAYARLKEAVISFAGIQTLHRQHKFLLLEHSPNDYYALGKIVGNAEHRSPAEVYDLYAKRFMDALEHLPTRKTRTNVLQHVLGFLRENAEAFDRQHIAELIELYRRGEVPFISPLTMLSHEVRKLGISYLEDQLFFSPFPRTLGAQARL